MIYLSSIVSQKQNRNLTSSATYICVLFGWKYLRFVPTVHTQSWFRHRSTYTVLYGFALIAVTFRTMPEPLFLLYVYISSIVLSRNKLNGQKTNLKRC